MLTECYPDCRIHAVFESREHGENAGDLAHSALRDRPALRGIYNASAGAAAVMRAREAVGRADTVLITHGLTDEYRGLLAAGKIDAILDRDPELEVRTVADLLAAHFGRAAALPTTLRTPTRIYMVENG